MKHIIPVHAIKQILFLLYHYYHKIIRAQKDDVHGEHVGSFLIFFFNLLLFCKLVLEYNYYDKFLTACTVNQQCFNAIFRYKIDCYFTSQKKQYIPGDYFVVDYRLYLRILSLKTTEYIFHETKSHFCEILIIFSHLSIVNNNNC